MNKLASCVGILGVMIWVLLGVVTMVGQASQLDEYDALRLKWKDFILHGDYDTNDPYIAEKLEVINERAQEVWDTLNKGQDRTYLWSDLSNGENDGTPMGLSYRRLYDMTRGYAMKGTSLYGNQEILTDILSGLQWLNVHWYNENEQKEGNSWWWDIGTPMALTDMCTILYDELEQARLVNYMRAIRHWTNPNGSPANVIDQGRAVIAEGILIKDGQRLIQGRDALSIAFPYVEEGAGFYRDGSFIEHSTTPYTNSYGTVLISGLSKLMYLLSDSSFDIVDPDVNNIYRWIYDSYEPVIYNSRAFDSLRGRGISRSDNSGLREGKTLLGSIALIAESANEEDKAYFKGMVKYMMDENEDFDEVEASIGDITRFKAIKEDSSIQSRGERIGHVEFNNMDRSSHMAEGYCYEISKSSKRTSRYESINGENLKGWFTGDGMTYLHNKDRYAYADGFWATVDYHRLPGITVDKKERNKVNLYGDRAPNAWSGGATIDGLYGVSGMKLEADKSSLEANKSWFMFDDEIVALGSGISAYFTRRIETIIEQRTLNEQGDNSLTVDGTLMPNNLGWEADLNQVSWAHLQGSASQGADIGYYFPNKMDLKGIRKSQTAPWSSVNNGGPTEPVTKNYVTLYKDHGKGPDDDTYSYVLLPNKSVDEVALYATTPGIIVVKNTEEVHCVKENNLGIVAANFWKDSKQSADIITSNKKAAVMVRTYEDDTLQVVINEPTMENNGSIMIEIDREARGGVIEVDPDIIVVETSPKIKLLVNTNQSKGKLFVAKFNIDPDAEPQPLNWASNSDFTAVYDVSPIDGNHSTNIVIAEYDVTPLSNNIDGVIGYTDASIYVNEYKDLAMIIRMNKDGNFDARHGEDYESLAEVPYEANKMYHIKIIADIAQGRYDVYVTPEGGGEIKLAEDYLFRTDGPSVTKLNKLCLKDNGEQVPLYKVAQHRLKAYWISSQDFSQVFDLGDGNGGIVTIDYQVTPQANNMDAVMGYADASVNVAGYQDLALIVRMNTEGYFDARQGEDYDSLTQVSYSKNENYAVRIEADMRQKTYDVYVTPEGGVRQQIADNYAFRTDAPSTNDLGKLCLKDNLTGGAGFYIENHTLTNEMETMMLYAVEDTYVWDGIHGDENHGASGFMPVVEGSESYSRNAYLKFDISAIGVEDIQSAKLRLMPQYDIPTNALHTAFLCQDTSWTEMGLTWNNQQVGQDEITSWNNVTKNEAVWIDVTDELISKMGNEAKLGIMIKNTSGEYAYVQYASREDQQEGNRPVIQIKY